MSDRPTFIREVFDQLAAYLPNPGGEVISPLDRLDANESPYDLPEELPEKLAWLYQQELENNRYPDGSHLALKEAIADYINESANLTEKIIPNNISVGNGSDEIIRSLLIATCLNGEGSVLVALPTFSVYKIMSETLGIRVVTIQRSQENFALNLNEAKQAIANTNNPPIRVVFVVHPNSPTGNSLIESEIAWLRSLPDNIMVVIDEAYFEFSGNTLVDEIRQRPNWVILRTFSKAFRLAAHRVGYAIAHPAVITALEKVRLPYNLPTFSQTAALFALENRDRILSSVAETIAERDKLERVLSAMSQLKVWSSSANFIYLRPYNYSQEDLDNLIRSLKARGTSIRHTGGGLRITVGTPEENERTISRLQEFFES